MATAAPGDIRSLAELSVRAKVFVMAGTLLGLFTAAMDQTIVSTSLPRIVTSLGGLGLFPWVFTAFMLTSTTTVPIVGKLTDMYGRKPFYMAGIAILIAGSALAGSSQSMGQLIAFRAVQGLGAGMIMGIAFAIVADVFPPRERGKWSGLLSAVFASASVIGPLIGGTLTDQVHWRWVFYVNLPLGGLALTVLALGMPALRPSRPGVRLDYGGIALLCMTVVPLLLALAWAGSQYSWLSPQIIGLLSLAAAAVVVFGYVEMRAGEPLLPLALLKNRIFTVAALATLLTGVAMFGAISFVPLFVQGVIGSSATNSGFVTMPMMISLAISSVIAGQIMSRSGRYRILGVFGLLVLASGMFLLSRMDVSTTRFIATRNMVVLGAGLGISLPLLMLAVQNAVPHHQMGIATSSMQFLRSVGGTMGVAVMGSLVNATLASELAKQTPAAVRENVPPELTERLKDPQALLSGEALAGVQRAFLGLGDRGQELFDLTLLALRSSLATAIAEAFLVGLFFALAALIVGVFLKEIPLRRTHFFAPDEAPEAVAETRPPVGSLPAAASASDGPAAAATEPTPTAASRPRGLPRLALRAAFVVFTLGLGALISFIAARNQRHKGARR